LKNYRETLQDDIGNLYIRKNLFLLKRAKGENVDPKNDEYLQRLATFSQAEKLFRVDLKGKVNQFLSKQPSGLPQKLLRFERQLFVAKEEVHFYEAFSELSYEAELRLNQAKVKAKQLPEIIENYKQLDKELSKARQESKRIDLKDEADAQKAYKAYKVTLDTEYEASKQQLKSKFNQGTISKKALKNGIVELKRHRSESLAIKRLIAPKQSIKELVSNKKYLLTKGISRQIKVMNSNLSDVRRLTPVEVNRTMPVWAFLSFPIPGLGQMLNGQWIKALLFFLGSIYNYFIAIPYALGYGNYQGDGLYGLMTLAEGGMKLDKSIIFMIEGVVALFLVIFAIGIFWLSFKDVLKVETDRIKGIRPRSWFETLVKIEQEGFPYLVSIPALVVTVFVVLVPITTAILLSFTGMDPQHQSKFGWVGLENYKLIAMGQGMAGSVFYSILGWTLIWTLASSTLAIMTGFTLAIIAHNERIIGKTFFRIIYLLPWAVPAFITIMFFSIMLSPDGAITQLVENTFNIQLEVKSSIFQSRLALIFMQVWLGSSYVFLLSTGVLQAIPEDLYEAAQIDGATEWQKLRRITVPIVLFQTAPLLVGQYTFNFNNFSIIYLFNSGGPFNPSKYGNLAGGTDLLISYIYKLTTENQYQAVGAAITIVISLGLMVFAFIGFKNSKAFKEERL